MPILSRNLDVFEHPESFGLLTSIVEGTLDCDRLMEGQVGCAVRDDREAVYVIDSLDQGPNVPGNLVVWEDIYFYEPAVGRQASMSGGDILLEEPSEVGARV